MMLPLGTIHWMVHAGAVQNRPWFRCMEDHESPTPGAGEAPAVGEYCGKALTQGADALLRQLGKVIVHGQGIGVLTCPQVLWPL